MHQSEPIVADHGDDGDEARHRIISWEGLADLERDLSHELKASQAAGRHPRASFSARFSPSPRRIRRWWPDVRRREHWAITCSRGCLEEELTWGIPPDFSRHAGDTF